MISLVLRDSAQKFNQAVDLACLDYSISISANGICCPRDRYHFQELIKSKLSANVESFDQTKAA
ncbi:MAG: hypothetical protein IM537_18760 [Pseudanabaena sp. M57BS1SP1A06MG]|nr:hypothetical protein [Pseudanabaena sp. M34BS1SP1A06MG]MCA6602191.1 hypothetical protein [Pseudanabaena sp. M57BS1SP1A06MG]